MYDWATAGGIERTCPGLVDEPQAIGEDSRVIKCTSFATWCIAYQSGPLMEADVVEWSIPGGCSRGN